MDDDLEVLDGAQIEKIEEGDGNRRSRLVLALILLLLLLLCVVTTVADVYTTAPHKSRVQAIVRNLECLQCHVELIPDFTKQSVHNPFENKRCTTCHTPHGEIVRTTESQGPVERWQRFRTLIEWLPLRIACQIGAGPEAKIGTMGSQTVVSEEKRKGSKSYLKQPVPDLCWMCHGNIGPQKSMPYQHNPFMKGRCLSCHDPHASDFPKLVLQDERDLCVTCHPIANELAMKQKHPPFESRSCTTCHHPHASDWKGILVERQRVLCFACHPTVAVLANKAVQHNPFEFDNCTGCHLPHASNTTPLLEKPQPALCYKCHPAVRNDFLKPSHHPVGTVKLNCGDCHNPHAADYQFLLDAKDNSFCYKCHAARIKATYQRSRHFSTLCIRCHTPHGSSYTPLLRKPNPPICLDCHGWIDYRVGKSNHEFQPKFWDVHAKKPLTCTSTCHDPHGTPFNFMLRNWYFPRDGGCLQCHRAVVGKRVGIDF